MLRTRLTILAARCRPDADNWLLWVLLPFALLLWCLHPQPATAILHFVNGATLAALSGLLALTKAVELSGVLQQISRRLLSRVRNERRLALLLVMLSMVLAATLTNDVSLFLLVPLTLTLATVTPLPVSRLVVCEALAVNAGSALTPIGNPQNLYLWQTSGISFLDFVHLMLPAVSTMTALLFVLVLMLFRPRPLTLHDTATPPAVQPRLLAVTALLFTVFVVLLDFHLAWPGVAMVFAAYGLVDRCVLRRMDWTLLIIIALMFVALGQLASLPAISQALSQLDIGSGHGAYLAGIIASQLISNVPATILLHGYTHDLRALAYGVNVGGFGLLIGSLANLIALRLAKQPGSYRLFHWVSAPFLVAATALVWPWVTP